MNITWLPEAEDRLPLLGSRFVNDDIALLNHLVRTRASLALRASEGRGEPSRRRSSWRKRLT